MCISKNRNYAFITSFDDQYCLVAEPQGTGVRIRVHGGQGGFETAECEQKIV